MSAGVATAKAAELPVADDVERMQLDTPSPDGQEEDLYTRLKTLQRQIEFLDIQVSGVGMPHSRRLLFLACWWIGA